MCVLLKSSKKAQNIPNILIFFLIRVTYMTSWIPEINVDSLQAGLSQRRIWLNNLHLLCCGVFLRPVCAFAEPVFFFSTRKVDDL